MPSTSAALWLAADVDRGYLLAFMPKFTADGEPRFVIAGTLIGGQGFRRGPTGRR